MHHVEGHCKFFLRGGGFQKESMKFNWNVQNWVGCVCGVREEGVSNQVVVLELIKWLLY